MSELPLVIYWPTGAVIKTPKPYVRKDIADKLADALKNMAGIRRGDGGTAFMPDEIIEEIISEYEALNDR